jgi:hypothetical protein
MQVIFKNKIIGRIENDTYISERTREHIFRKFENGFGISSKVIDYLESQGVTTVRIIFENIHTFECPINFFYIKGIEYKDGEDSQLILPNKFFNQKIVNEVQNVL